MKRLISYAFLFLFGASCAVAANEPRITRVSKDVKLLRPSAKPHKASANDVVANGTAIETGPESQAELRFDNGTVVRLGANSVFAPTNGVRRMGLGRGAMLVRVPRTAGEAQVATGNVTSSIGGTTTLLEHYPEAYIKLISIEGTARMFMRGKLGESVLIDPGQLVMFHTKPKPTALPNPVDIDIKRLMATSLLIKGLPPLGSESAIAGGMQNQSKQKSQGALADTNLVIFGRGTMVSLVPPEAEAQEAKPTPTPSPKR